MIGNLRKDGTNAPMIVCDVCRERITDFQMGAAVFPLGTPNGHISPVLHAHKRTCHDAADAQVREQGGTPGWDELRDHVRWLAANCGLTPATLADDEREREVLERL
jgi:hypothetical protein